MRNQSKASKSDNTFIRNFETDFERTKRHSHSFASAMWKISETEKVTYQTATGKKATSFIRDRNHFAEVTGLGPSTYDRIKSKSTFYVPSLTTFMTLCKVYDLNSSLAKVLRSSYGYDFNPNSREHQAYIYLLDNCRGASLSYCNSVLKSLGIEKKYYLGDGTIGEEATEAEE